MKLIAGMGMLILLLVFPETALNAALSSAHAWYISVAPALFPFMALMPLLTCPDSVRAWERMFGRWMRPLLNLPGAAAPALVIAMTAGSPAGAHAAVRICAEAGMSRSQLERIVMCVCGLSPAFLITGVGASMLGSAADGRILLRGQLFSQIVMLLLTRNIAPDERLPEGDASVNPEPVRAAVMNILAVCGYMCLFSVAAAMIERVVRSKMAGMIALCLLDAPSAARALAFLSIGREAKLMLLAAVTGLGGACMAAQNLAACKKMGVKTGKYTLARVSHALLCAAAVAVQLRWNTKTAHFSMQPMEFSALIAAFLSVPVLIFWKKDPFLNKRIFPDDDKKASKIREKTQYDVSE